MTSFEGKINADDTYDRLDTFAGGFQSGSYGSGTIRTAKPIDLTDERVMQLA